MANRKIFKILLSEKNREVFLQDSNEFLSTATKEAKENERKNLRDSCFKVYSAKPSIKDEKRTKIFQT